MFSTNLFLKRFQPSDEHHDLMDTTLIQIQFLIRKPNFLKSITNDFGRMKQMLMELPPTDEFCLSSINWIGRLNCLNFDGKWKFWKCFIFKMNRTMNLFHNLSQFFNIFMILIIFYSFFIQSQMIISIRYQKLMKDKKWKFNLFSPVQFYARI